MWKKHQSVFQDHVKYIHNSIVKPFIFGILQYVKHFCEMHGVEKYLTPPSMKVGGFEEANRAIKNKEFNKDVIRVATKDKLPKSIQDGFEDNHKNHRSITHE